MEMQKVAAIFTNLKILNNLKPKLKLKRNIFFLQFHTFVFHHRVQNFY